MILTPDKNPNEHLSNMAEQTATIGLIMNSNKTPEMIVSRIKCDENILKIEEIERKDEIKYLGILINCNFKMSDNCKKIIQYSNKILFLLNRLRRIGMDEEGSQLLFNALIISKITYGIEFWWAILSKSEKLNLQNIISKAHRRGLSGNLNLEQIAHGRIRKLYNKVVNTPNHILRKFLLGEGRRHRPIVPYLRTTFEQKAFFNYICFPS